MKLGGAFAAPARVSAKLSQGVGRSNQSALGRWFWEIDRVLLLFAFILMAVGLIAVAAASPAAAERYSGGSVVVAPLHYFWKQLAWMVLGLPVMIGVSMMTVQNARRFCLGGAAFFTVMLAMVPLIGSEHNGAQRWIELGIGELQPSEFLKPLFVVSLAWLLSLKQHDKSLPVAPLSFVLTAIICGFLMKQPDFGQSVVFCSLWLALMLLSGLSFRLLAMLGAGGIVAIVLAYLFYPVATLRIDNFLFQQGDTYQVDSAHATLVAGGFFGAGPGGGEKKFHLPEAQTDYIFSVIGEEFGLIACIAIALLFTAIVVRVFVKLLDEDDPFVVLAAAGLTTQFAVQAMINIAVNVHLAPSKGMTLPFISYGGSSMLALCMGFGLLLAFTRRNPYLTRSPYVVRWNTR
jgi:cell division protein FtsW